MYMIGSASNFNEYSKPLDNTPDILIDTLQITIKKWCSFGLDVKNNMKDIADVCIWHIIISGAPKGA